MSALRAPVRMSTLKYAMLRQALHHKNATKYLYRVIENCVRSPSEADYESLFAEKGATSNEEADLIAKQLELVQTQNPVSRFQTIQGDLMHLYLHDQYLYSVLSGDKSFQSAAQLKALLADQDSWNNLIQFDSLRTEAENAASRWEKYIFHSSPQSLQKTILFQPFARDIPYESNTTQQLHRVMQLEFLQMKKNRLDVADALAHLGKGKFFHRRFLTSTDAKTNAELSRMLDRSDVNWL